MSKTIVKVIVEPDIELVDGGYMAHKSSTIDDIKKWAADQMRSKQFLIKQGGCEPKAIASRYTIKEIIFKED